MEATETTDTLERGHTTEAIGWLSAELASRADAWKGNAPDWFPEPPDWLDLWDRALSATAESYEIQVDAFRAAIEVAERAHLLTIGSPARGLALRVTLGHLSCRGRWHGWLPDAFLIWKGKRV